MKSWKRKQSNCLRISFLVWRKHFGETDVLEFGMNEKRSEKMNAEYPLKMKITFAVDLEGDPAEIAKERQKFVGYPSAKHCRNLEKHQDQEYKHE